MLPLPVNESNRRRRSHHMLQSKYMQHSEGHTLTSLHWYEQVARATHKHKQHLRAFKGSEQLLFWCCCFPPPLHSLSALVSWHSGWVLSWWTCLLTASDKLSGPLISATTTSLACSACMVGSTLNLICKGFCCALILWNDYGKLCVEWLSPFMMSSW